MTHFVQDVKDIWRLAVPYFRRKAPGEIHLWLIGPVRMPENWIGIGLLAFVVALEVGGSYMSKLLNNWSQGFGDSIQAKDWHAFLASLGEFALIVTPYLIIFSLNNYINQVLQIRWRRAMTDDFVARWLSPAQHYRMRLVAGQADNPDQRISDDIHQFVGNTMVLGVGFFGNFLRLAIFLQVLWVLSTAFPMTSFGLSFNIPGYLVWLAVLYAGLGTALTYLIGRQLVNLKYNQERFEANFRFGMARIRENSEQIALLGGEAAERSALDERYNSILGNVYGVVRLQLRLNFFSFFFSQFSNIFPYLLLGPAFFFGTATYGTLMRSVSTFGRVQDGLTWFADSFQQLANYRAIVQRRRQAQHRDPPRHGRGLRGRRHRGEPSRPHAADRGAVLQPAGGRPRAAVGPVGIGQDDPAARLLGRVALRRRAHRRAGRDPQPGAAAAVLPAARHAAPGHRLPPHARCLSRRRGARRAGRRGPGPSRAGARPRRQLAAAPVRRRAAAPRGRPRDPVEARLAVPRRGDVGARC
jgi:ABC-type long-subunit fatty acid transport system fused permease/ATPase subunit